MSYDHTLLCRDVVSLLHQRPRLTATALAKQLRVDRHTISRAIRTELELTFRELQARECLASIRRHMTESPELCLKEIAARLRYASGASFARRVRSLERCSPTDLRRKMRT